MEHPHVSEKVIRRQRNPWRVDDDHLVESGCFGISSEEDELADRGGKQGDRGLVSGFQHVFDVDASRTDSMTTVHTIEVLLAEIS